MNKMHRASTRRLVWLCAAMTALLALLGGGYQAAPATAQAGSPPSLEGENFVAVDDEEFEFFGHVDVRGNCTPAAGQTFTITYSAEGVALGPYPGTFKESGTVEVLLAVVPYSGFGYAIGPVTSWTANFTIDSPVGQVRGTKTLADQPGEFWFDDSSAYCARQPAEEHRSAFVDAEGASAYRLHYEATIQTASGTFTDEGRAYASADRVCLGTSTGTCNLEEQQFFRENFYLSSGVLPLDTTGKATGGGQLGDITAPAHVTFAFEVKQPELGKLQGRCLVNDSGSNTRVKCLNVANYAQIGNTATWDGEAEVNGVVEDYQITVTDNGEPNQGIDTFAIKTDTYDAAGNVQRGNVQVHKQALAP